METIYFVKDSDFREVHVMTNGTYRITGRHGTMGKLHNNATKYISEMLKNGWKKCNIIEYLRTK